MDTSPDTKGASILDYVFLIPGVLLGYFFSMMNENIAPIMTIGQSQNLLLPIEIKGKA